MQTRTTDKFNNLVILQANIGRSQDASVELMEMAHKVSAPILIIQEPYSNNRHKICGLGTYSNQILAGNKPNEKPWACICITDKNYTATLLRNISSSHCVCAHVSGPTGGFYVISLYCQFSEPIDKYMQQLGYALQTINSPNVIIGTDVNGVSPL